MGQTHRSFERLPLKVCEPSAILRQPSGDDDDEGAEGVEGAEQQAEAG